MNEHAPKEHKVLVMHTFDVCDSVGARRERFVNIKKITNSTIFI